MVLPPERESLPHLSPVIACAAVTETRGHATGEGSSGGGVSGMADGTSHPPLHEVGASPRKSLTRTSVSIVDRVALYGCTAFPGEVDAIFENYRCGNHLFFGEITSSTPRKPGRKKCLKMIQKVIPSILVFLPVAPSSLSLSLSAATAPEHKIFTAGKSRFAALFCEGLPILKKNLSAAAARRTHVRQGQKLECNQTLCPPQGSAGEAGGISFFCRFFYI